MWRWLACALLASTASACSFRHGAAGAPAGDAAADDATSIDAPVPDAPARTYWLALALSRPGGPAVALHAFDELGHITPCTEQPAPRVITTFASHPSLPFVYESESELAGVALGCAGDTWVGAMAIGTPRARQRIVLDASRGVGFFTIDGPGSLGVYRFTTAADGTPTVTSSAAATSQAGALVLDNAGGVLYTAGTSVVASYALSGPALDLPMSTTTASSCAQPIDLLLSGSSLLAFCGDVPDVWRYTTGPLAYDTKVGALGTVSAVVALPGDRAIAARTSPPDLAVVALGGGTPTWTSAASLASPATAIGVSPDGTMLVTARAIDPTSSELAYWKIGGDTLVPLATEPIDAQVTAIAITTPGS